MILIDTGIGRNTPDPEGGRIDRYPEGHSLCGEPTGVIREVSEKLFAEFLIPTETDMSSAIKGKFNPPPPPHPTGVPR